jgi:hypothetical protein
MQPGKRPCTQGERFALRVKWQTREILTNDWEVLERVAQEVERQRKIDAGHFRELVSLPIQSGPTMTARTDGARSDRYPVSLLSRST